MKDNFMAHFCINKERKGVEALLHLSLFNVSGRNFWKRRCAFLKSSRI